MLDRQLVPLPNHSAATAFVHLGWCLNPQQVVPYVKCRGGAGEGKEQDTKLSLCGLLDTMFPHLVSSGKAHVAGGHANHGVCRRL